VLAAHFGVEAPLLDLCDPRALLGFVLALEFGHASLLFELHALELDLGLTRLVLAREALLFEPAQPLLLGRLTVPGCPLPLLLGRRRLRRRLLRRLLLSTVFFCSEFKRPIAAAMELLKREIRPPASLILFEAFSAATSRSTA
jgi:hypothetical protein